MGNSNCFGRTFQTTTSKKDSLDQLGVSVFHLQHDFLRQVRDAGLDPSTSEIYKVENLQNHDHGGVIRTKGEHVLCPMDGRMGAAYVHSILDQGDDHVGPATIMLSYGWGYIIGDVVDTLVDYCHSNHLDPKRVYVWICCLCNNQHRVVENKRIGKVIPFEEFRDIFFGRVTGIGHVLSMMAPWENPLYLKRIWCIFEFFVANEEDCKVTIVMPPTEKKKLVNVLSQMGGKDALYDALASTDVERAEASEKTDLETILALIQVGPGYTAFNVKVNNLIRAWVTSAILGAVEDRTRASDHQETDMDLSFFLHMVAEIFSSNGQHDQALEMWNRSLAIVERAHGPDDPAIAPRLIGIGNILRERKDLDGALNMFVKSLAIYEALGDYASIAASCNNIGYVLELKGLLDESLDLHKKSLFIEENLLHQKNHTSIAKTYGHIGVVMMKKGELEEALKMHKKSLEIEEGVHGRFYPDVAIACSNVAAVLTALGRYPEALEMLQRSFKIREKIIGMDSDKNALAYGKIGALLRDKGELDEALKVLRKAALMRESGTVYNNIGIVLRDKGELDEAMNMYEKCLSFCQASEDVDPGLLGTTYNNMGGKLDEAMEMLEKSLNAYKLDHGEYSAYNAIPYKNMGLVLRDKGETEDGLEFLQKALEIRREKMGANHLLTKQVEEEINKFIV